MRYFNVVVVGTVALFTLHGGRSLAAAEKVFHAGVAAVDVTPTMFPVLVNGMFEERTAAGAVDRLMSRAIVLDDGETQLAIVVVDNLMLPRDLLDDAKEQASQATGIPTDRILISATHTHSAPSAMGCLGSNPDLEYQRFLPPRIARSIALAAERVVPARIGWNVVQAPEHNHCRRWIFRSDRTQDDPFGVRNVRANMHPGYQSPNHVGPSGPPDQDLTLVSLQTQSGELLAVLGNYAMHYFGSPLVSADFCGQFGDHLANVVGKDKIDPSFVGIMAQGTSGDSMWMDYSQPQRRISLDEYTAGVAKIAHAAIQKIKYHDHVPLAMAESKLSLRRRTPDTARLEWARQLVAAHGDQPFRAREAIYAREQILLHEQPEVELKLQAIRIGDLAICALPNEVYGLTGWKLKAQSPFGTTFNIVLANGAEGYIPPPEQHDLGGYTTWAARTAGLEVDAEPKIVQRLLDMLAGLAEKPLKKLSDEPSAYSCAVMLTQPKAFWRLGEMEGRMAQDHAGNSPAKYEPGVAYYLEGDPARGLQSGLRGNRAAHFAGGRVVGSAAGIGDEYTVEGWLWNGLPHDARAVTGYFFSRGPANDPQVPGDHVGVGGVYRPEWTGKLIVFNGNARDEVVVGKTVLPLRSWHHLAFVRKKNQVAIYLNGHHEPEAAGELANTIPNGDVNFFLGGRSDNLFNWEGKLDEFALYDRALTADEIAAHYASAERGPGKSATTTPAEPSPAMDPAPMSPAESLKALKIRPGFQAELVAHEPLVLDPVAIDWGADGKLWVAEMADYPLGVDGQGKPGGRIRVLEDTDHDGRYDRGTVFLEGLSFPTGVLTWGKGILVTAAPEIIYAEDTNHDGQADVRRTLFTGFLEGNQQLRVNGLRVGLDNWVYCASGSHHSGYGAKSQIKSEITGEEVYIGSRDFRFQPDTGRMEPLSGPSQFGRNRDDWGHWFGVQNSHPIWHYVLEDRYTRRNPHVIPPDPKRHLLPTNPPVFSAKPPEKRFHSFQESGRFTSACSAMIYRDSLLFRGVHAFTCEPFHNLVQHNVLTPDGVSFRAARDPAEHDREFLASEDRWCRPVMAITGPDGALWIVDMYRYMIEHPEWLPPEGKEELRPYYRAGDDRGRIYRIYPADRRPTAAVVRMDQLSTSELVARLCSTNGWQRDMAQRLLIAKQDSASVRLLEELTIGEEPLGRLHALWTLAALGQLRAEVLAARLADSHPQIRRNALLLTEGRPHDAAFLLPRVLSLVDDPDPQVRLQLACTLGEFRDPQIGPALAHLAIAHEHDPVISGAVVSSVTKENIAAVLTTILSHAEKAGLQFRLFDTYLALAITLGADDAVTQALAQIVQDLRRQPRAWHFTAIAGAQEAMRRRTTATSPPQPTWMTQIHEVQSVARRIVVDAATSEAMRSKAVDILGRDAGANQAADWEIFRTLLTPQTPATVQTAVVAQLAKAPDPQVAAMLLQGWRSHSPALRSQIVATLATRPQWAAYLVEQIENQHLLVGEIDVLSRGLLFATKDESLRQRLEAQFANTTSEDRKQAIAVFQSATQLKGDFSRGSAVFQKHCASCHKLGGFGQEVGPNLAALSNKTPSALLVSILDPSSAVDSKFVSYLAVTTDGRSLSGIVATETGASVTLLAADGKRQDILRSDIESLQSTGKSLMPDGFERDLIPQDLADLIQFVAQAGAEKVE